MEWTSPDISIAKALTKTPPTGNNTMSSPPLPTDDAPYELVYWPGLPGRGELIRVLFEEAGVPYTDTARSAGDEAVSAVLGYISPDAKGHGANPPVLAPPILRHGSLVLHQTPNILLYLATRFGLAPALDDDGLLHLNQMVLTIIDGLVNEVHETHHPVAVSAVYEDQKPEAKKRSKVFRHERLPKYLAYVQRLLDAETSGPGPWLYGGRLTYADLVLFQTVDGTMYAFPKTMDALQRSGKYAGVFALYDAVKQRPRIKAYLASDRRTPYSNGIWRRYPELEED